tara:strand:- start:253 stop:483 length:231 start_codon:yes stop_codon:yes gene_type:complete
MTRENQEKLSGLWVNETKNGQKYFSGKNDGFKYTIFKNGFKEPESKQPDYILYREPVEEQQNAPSRPAQNTNELPF